MLAYFLAKITQAPAVLASRLSVFGVGAIAPIAAGFVVALSAAALIATSHSWLALPALFSGPLLSAVGQVNASARIERVAAAFDLIVLASVPFAFSLADPSRALAAAFLLFSMIAAAAASLLANEARKLTNIDMAACVCAFALACFVTQWFSLIAYVLGLLCFIAAGARFAIALARIGA